MSKNEQKKVLKFYQNLISPTHKKSDFCVLTGKFTLIAYFLLAMVSLFELNLSFLNGNKYFILNFSMEKTCQT